MLYLVEFLTAKCNIFDKGEARSMVDEYSVIPAGIFHIPAKEARMYAREGDGFIYFWDPNDKYGSVIVDTKNGSYLSAKRGVTYKTLSDAFLKGYRS